MFTKKKAAARIGAILLSALICQLVLVAPFTSATGRLRNARLHACDALGGGGFLMLMTM